jgi:beta-galactosidase/beta-glucuronidase
VPFAPQASLSGVAWKPADVLWYRRRFDAPAAPRLLLHLGAVDYRATVWVNGEEVARHQGGHTPFSADLTGRVRDRDNELVVRAEDPLADPSIPRGKQYWKPEPEGIFYAPTSGIWQTVWLEPLPERPLEIVELRSDPNGIDFDIRGEGEVQLTTGGATWKGPPGRGRMELEVQPWSPDQPNLHSLNVRVGEDRVETYFGLRSEEPLVQRLVLDQGYFPGGRLTAPTDSAFRRDIRLAKAMGFNGARKHQKVEDPRWLYWADRMGFLVWGEMPNAHAATAEAEARTRAELAEAVRRDRGHPCVAAWVPMNESFGLRDTTDGERARVVESLYRLTKKLDPTRPVVSNDGWEHATSDLLTLHDYDPPGKLAARYRSLAAALDAGGRPHPPYLPGYGHRGEPVIVSEFGGLVVNDAEAWGYGMVRDATELVATYRAEVEALMGPGPVEGFCYTQLTDVEQERNGLLTFDRRPKADPGLIREATLTPKRQA